MSTPPRSATELAKQFIDDVIRINTEYGMRTVASEETYNAAVRSAANAYRAHDASPVERQSP